MHPLTPGGDAFVNNPPRNNNDERDVTPMPTAPQQMTYFLTTEDDIDSPESPSQSSTYRSRGQNKNNMFGVESLETSVDSMSQSHDLLHKSLQRAASRTGKRKMGRPSPRKSEDSSIPDSISSSSHSSPHASRDNSPADQRRATHTKNNNSQSLTPLSLPSPPSGNIPSFMTSRRNSAESLFTDDAVSQAIVSSEDDDQETMPSQVMDSGSIPQLVMPSIRMPSRRPFTEKGKNMGRLKVLIAGDSDVGKTSLIKAIVQICEDIVHVDPLATTSLEVTPKSYRKLSKSRIKSGIDQSTSQISEVYASTRPYPSWWSEIDDTKILRRRKSMGDTVLERNLCFVDTPGYGRGTSCMESISPVVDYVETQFTKNSTLSDVTDGELLNLMSGNGGFQVDVVFYTIRSRISPVDIEYLRRLSIFTNIIPIIAQCDMLLAPELETLKASIASELQEANINIFSFGRPQTSIYAVSTIASQDEDNMDASILMSPDYVQPIIKTDLADLVTSVFNPDSVCFLRHLAATKFMKWRKNKSSSTLSSLPPQINFTPSLSLGASTYSISSAMSNRALVSPVGATSTYALARIADHTRREEQLAQVRLSKWAHDLQQSMQNERARYEALCKGERAVWLTERLGECVRDGTLVALASQESGALVHQSDKTGSGATQTQTYWRANSNRNRNTSDPLGLISLNESIKRCSWIALQVVSGLGVVGGLAIWLGGGKNWLNFSDDNKVVFWGEWERLGWSRW